MKKTIGCSLVFAMGITAPAQCLFSSVTTQVTGAGCNVGSTGYCKIVGLPTTTEFALDVANCSLDVHVNLFEACGVTVPLRLLAVSFAPIPVPLPDLGLGCTLHLLPEVVIAGSANPIQLSLPPGVPMLGFFTQALALSLAPAGGQGSDTVTLSEARFVALQ